MKEKILPLKEAKVVTYNFEAFPMSILEANGDEYYEWLYTNYIQLNSHNDIKKSGDLFLAFYDNQALKSPYLIRENTKWSSLSKLKISIHEYIEQYIDMDYYLYFQVDEFFIPERGAYKKRHYLHDILVYGYNSGKEYYVVGYNQDGLYVTSKVSCSQFEKAFINNFVDKESNEWADNIYLLKYNKKCHYKFNLSLVIKLLCDYLNSENEFEQKKRYGNPLDDTVYGISCYDKIIEYLNYLQQGVHPFKEYGIDNRIFRTIQEHKAIMYDRIKYLNENIVCINDLLIEYSEVCNLAKRCHLLAIKYRLSPKSSIIDRLKNYIIEIKEKDRKIIEKLLTRLQRMKRQNNV